MMPIVMIMIRKTTINDANSDDNDYDDDNN